MEYTKKEFLRLMFICHSFGLTESIQLMNYDSEHPLVLEGRRIIMSKIDPIPGMEEFSEKQPESIQALRLIKG